MAIETGIQPSEFLANTALLEAVEIALVMRNQEQKKQEAMAKARRR